MCPECLRSRLCARMLDTLPAAVKGVTLDGSVMYSRGMPIGGGAFYLFNHVTMTVQYHTSKEFKGGRIVGFYVQPVSVQHSYNADGTLATCDKASGVVSGSPHLQLSASAAPINVTWTYDVTWEESATKWASRWDIYLSMNNRYSSDVHWFSILNSTIIVVFLTVGWRLPPLFAASTYPPVMLVWMVHCRAWLL